MLRKRDIRKTRKEKERRRSQGFSSLEIFEAFTEAAAKPSWSPGEWLPNARIITPYWQRKLLWPSCSTEAQRAFYRINRARIRANQKRYYQRTKVTRNATSMAWQRRNRDRVLARRRARYAANPQRERDRQRAWRLANSEKVKESKRRRRAAASLARSSASSALPRAA